jgi:hypothetical protein
MAFDNTNKQDVQFDCHSTEVRTWNHWSIV